MGGGPVLEEAYFPGHWPYSRYHHRPVYASSFPGFCNFDVQSALSGVLAALHDLPFQQSPDGTRTDMREDIVKQNNTAVEAHEPVISVDSSPLSQNGPSRAPEGMVSSPVKAEGSAHDAQNLDTNSKNFGGEDMSPTTESLVDRSMDISSSGDDESSGSAQSDEVQSEEEIAAVRVQAGYRGYVVRRSRPLAQLRTIANVEARLKELKEQACDAAFQDEVLKEGSMARLRFMESTMALLLQLDGIQGVHPDVRNIRKAVTRKIISLMDALSGPRSSHGR